VLRHRHDQSQIANRDPIAQGNGPGRPPIGTDGWRTVPTGETRSRNLFAGFLQVAEQKPFFVDAEHVALAQSCQRRAALSRGSAHRSFLPFSRENRKRLQALTRKQETAEQKGNLVGIRPFWNRRPLQEEGPRTMLNLTILGDILAPVTAWQTTPRELQAYNSALLAA
jgi:hypothetical protein